MQHNDWKTKAARTAIVPAAFVLGVGLTAAGLRGNAGQQAAKPPVTPPAQALEIQSAFEQVADHLNPSIVFISSRQAAKVGGADESPFNFQFPGGGGGRGFRLNPGGGAAGRRSYASGSGVIIRGDGYILTNDHVVQGADKVTVELADGRKFTGQVKRDFKSDLALVKIEATGLPAAELADSDKVKVGQWAIAFGAPFGQELRNSMTVGVVSARGRSQTIGAGNEQRYYTSLIQTDASINPGNSGGPLIDLYGRVIGINVAIESPSGGNVGIGFAIPANTVKYVMEQLMTKGSVTRGFLGLAPRDLDFDEQDKYGVRSGALVASVQDGTPAAKAGFQVEDVITKFDTKEIVGEADLRDMISRTAPGTSIPVMVKRDGKTLTLNVTLGKPEEKVAAADEPDATKTVVAKSKLGIRVGDTTDPDVRDQLKLKKNVQAGAVITEVVDGSPASNAKLLPGDIITRLDGKKVTNADELTAVAQALKPGSTVTMIVRRGSDTILAQIELE